MVDREHVIGIVVAEFNRDITNAMVSAAEDEASALDARIACIVRVPGSYEIPLLANTVLADPDITAVVVLGYIERGETLHGEVMAHTVSSCLLNSSLAHGKPVGIGIIGPGAVLAQAESRKESYSRAAVRAAVAASREMRRRTARS